MTGSFPLQLLSLLVFVIKGLAVKLEQLSGWADKDFILSLNGLLGTLRRSIAGYRLRQTLNCTRMSRLLDHHDTALLSVCPKPMRQLTRLKPYSLPGSFFQATVSRKYTGASSSTEVACPCCQPRLAKASIALA